MGIADVNVAGTTTDITQIHDILAGGTATKVRQVHDISLAGTATWVYPDLCTIISRNPYTVSANTATVITLTGTGFLSADGVYNVSTGAYYAITIDSNTQLRFTMPAFAGTTHTIQVYNSRGNSNSTSITANPAAKYIFSKGVNQVAATSYGKTTDFSGTWLTYEGFFYAGMNGWTAPLAMYQWVWLSFPVDVVSGHSTLTVTFNLQGHSPHGGIAGAAGIGYGSYQFPYDISGGVEGSSLNHEHFLHFLDTNCRNNVRIAWGGAGSSTAAWPVGVTSGRQYLSLVALTYVVNPNSPWNDSFSSFAGISNAVLT